MVVGPQHGIDALDVGVEELGSDIRRGIDQQRLAPLLDQDRAAAAAIARVVGIGGAPLALPVLATRPRHTARGAAAQDGYAHFRRSAFAKSRKKLSVVAASNSAMPTPFSSATLAAVWATKAGSLVLPRLGTGAR